MLEERFSGLILIVIKNMCESDCLYGGRSAQRVVRMNHIVIVRAGGVRLSRTSGELVVVENSLETGKAYCFSCDDRWDAFLDQEGTVIVPLCSRLARGPHYCSWPLGILGRVRARLTVLDSKRRGLGYGRTDSLGGIKCFRAQEV